MAERTGSPGSPIAIVALSLAVMSFILTFGVLLPRSSKPPREDDSDLADPVSMENRLVDAERRLEAAERRISDLEKRGERSGAPVPQPGHLDGPITGVAKEGGEAPLPAGAEARAREKEYVLEAIRKGTWSSDSLAGLMARSRLLGGHAEAIAEMEKYAAERETSPEALAALGTAYGEAIKAEPPGPARTAWAEKAVKAFVRVLLIDTKSREALVGIASAWKAAGDVEKAREAVKRGLTVYPGDEGLQRMLEGLE